MTIRQSILKNIYPYFSKLYSALGKNNKQLKSTVVPNNSIYNLSITLNNGQEVSFEKFRNKKLMIVNTASDCGYTNQYEGLQQLYDKHKNEIEIIAFPSNDFGEQEKATNETIASFCKVNFGITFPLMQKTVVKKKVNQHPVYQWLTDETKNGWNYIAPTWNFCKYIIDEKGNLTNFFEASTEPMSKEMLDAIK